MSKADIFLLIMFTPFLLVGLYGVLQGIKGILREISYKRNGMGQHVMFNQLKKGDFVWCVNGDELHYRFVKNVSYNFAGTDVTNIVIEFYGDYNDLKIKPEDAKTYRYAWFYTLMGDAKAQADYVSLKRNESVKESQKVTPEEIIKGADFVMKRIEKIKKDLK